MKNEDKKIEEVKEVPASPSKEQLVNNIVSNAMMLVNREIKLMAQDLINVLTTKDK